jgi:sirohydrochlorin ferrochelatase
MTAPALVALACGPVDADSARTVHEIVSTTRRLRPDLRTEAAFSTGAKPSLEKAVGALASRGHEEIVVVPLLAASTDQAELDVLTAVDVALRSNPGVSVRAAGMIGADAALVTASIARLARLWSGRHHLPTSIAFADASPPSTGEAVRDWRRQGKRHVAVGSLFITSGPHADRAAELAFEAGACAVSGPLGAHDELSRLIVSRYSVGALALVPV